MVIFAVMYKKSIIQYFLVLLLFLEIVACTDEDTFKTDISDFENLVLENESYWNGSDGSGQFIDGNKVYYNSYYADWDTWSGFAYSNIINYLYYNSESMYAAYPSGG
ncbi:MAG: hypothetical protein KAQ75_15885, partial [Bacteroidales bacterium]|nr:hypothetical protein [Bacteroidales bacterium]